MKKIDEQSESIEVIETLIRVPDLGLFQLYDVDGDGNCFFLRHVVNART